tara:strand:- start:346 stop:480 length:135 start_codon:yes stop_codon:yes gene_type:complete
MRPIKAYDAAALAFEEGVEAVAGDVTPDLAMVTYQLAKAVGVWR